MQNKTNAEVIRKDAAVEVLLSDLAERIGMKGFFCERVDATQQCRDVTYD